MSSSFARNLAFDEDTGYEFSAEVYSPSAPNRIDLLLQALGPKMMAMGGLALFAFALVVAFRIIALDAAHQLEQPAIDFAICGAVAFLGLSISWVHLGDHPRSEGEYAAEDSIEFAFEVPPAPAPLPPALHTPASFAPAVSVSPLRKKPRQHWMGGRACRFCRQKMTAVGQALYRCRSCHHLESNSRVSFLDSAFSCHCHHCRHSS